MKLTVFPSDHGDCLLLESAGQRMLIDGGPGTSFRKHVLPYLGETADQPLDFVYLSHIDHDHIGGLLVLLEALFEWTVYQYRLDQGKSAKKPKMPRPPEVRKVWHNGFQDMLPGQALPIASTLENTARSFRRWTWRRSIPPRRKWSAITAIWRRTPATRWSCNTASVAISSESR